MAIIDNNPIMKGVRGMLGGTIVYREVNGRLIMANRPKKRSAPTAHQLKTKSRFLEAVIYAKSQMMDPQAKAEYQFGVNSQMVSAYNVALTDYLKGPEIRLIDVNNYTGTIGSTITVSAIDNFRVTTVRVEIRSSEDLLIEQGEAVNDPHNFQLWTYLTSQSNLSLPGTRVHVFASDKPGNVTKKIVVCS